MNNNDSFNKCKFRSYSNINHFINNNNMNNMDNKYYKYSNSINDIHNPRRVIKKIKQKNNYNYFELTKKKDNKELFIRNNFEKENKKENYFANQRLNNFINKDKDNPNRNNNNDSFLEKEYGSFDNYFIDNQSYKGKDIHNLNKINFIYKNEKYFNIYNIIKKDKIIQNNFYNTNNNKLSNNNNNNKNLKVENQKSVSYLGTSMTNNKNINNKCNESDTSENEEQKGMIFQENQLKKCFTSDVFLPHKSYNNVKYNNIENKLVNNNGKQIKETISLDRKNKK